MLIAAGPAHAAVNIAVNATVPSGNMYQGQASTMEVAVKNYENFAVRINKVNIHFDWMPDGSFYTLYFNNGYIQVESNNGKDLGDLIVICDPGASPGYHQYYFLIEVSKPDMVTYSWTDETVEQAGAYVYVESPDRQKAHDLLNEANQTLFEAQKAGYKSRSALAGLNEAGNSMNAARSAYGSGDFGGAINATYSATRHLSLAKAAEDDYRVKYNGTIEYQDSLTGRLALLSSPLSPEAMNKVSEAYDHLNLSKICLGNEDFDMARNELKIADKLADDALNAEYLYEIRQNEAEEARKNANSSIAAAEENIVKAGNLTSPPASGILKNAYESLEKARESYNSSKYSEAMNDANVASVLVIQAMKVEADYYLQKAGDSIAAVGELNSEIAKNQLDLAKVRYNESMGLYADGNYRGAVTKAEESYMFANETVRSERQYEEENPLSTVPGFGAVAAIISVLVVAYALREGRD